MAKKSSEASRQVSDTLVELKSIGLKGFKAIRDRVNVLIHPLTLLAGQNSAGKSTVVQPLLLMKQTLEATHDPGVLELNGSCVKYNEASQLLWKGKSKADKAKSWEVELQVGAGFVRVEYELRSGGLGVVKTEMKVRDKTLVLKNNMSQSEKDAAVKKSAFWGTAPKGYTLEVDVTEDRCAHRLEGRMFDGEQSSPFPFVMVNPLPTEMIEAIIHLPGLRGNPERAYPVTRVSNRYPGVFSRYTASVLLAWAETKDPRLTSVGEDLARLGLTWKVAPKRLDDTHVEIRVGRLPHAQHGGAQDFVNIADVGFGASQVLPVVVALHAATVGQIVHIEQPELHLHPNAQVAMAELLLAAAKRGVRLIVETHSSVLLKRIQVAIARGDNGARPELVALHWFTRDVEGVTRVTTAKLENDGSYGDWPVDFADVELRVEEEFIRAAVERMSADE